MSLDSSNHQNRRLLQQLFHEDNVEGILFHRDSIVLRRAVNDESRDFIGSIFILQKSPVGAERFHPVSVPQPHYIVWIPYSYLFCLANHVLTPNGRNSIAITQDLEYLTMQQQRIHSSINNNEVPQEDSFPLSLSLEEEWSHTICLPLQNIEKIIRKSNLRGRRIITLIRADTGASEAPLSFEDGGMIKFFDELKKISTVKNNPRCADEVFISDEIIPLSHVLALDASIYPEFNNIVHRSGQSEIDPSDTPASSGSEEYDVIDTESIIGTDEWKTSRVGGYLKHSGLSSKATRSTGKSVIGAVCSWVNISKGTKAVGKLAARLQGDIIDTLMSDNNAQDTSDKCSPVDSFCEPTEHIPLVPSLKINPNKRLAPPLTRMDWRACFEKEDANDKDAKPSTRYFSDPGATSISQQQIFYAKTGRIDADQFLRIQKKVYNGGISDAGGEGDKELRGEVWAYLLSIFPIGSTAAERIAIIEQSRKEYACLTNQWQSIFPAQEAKFALFREHKIAIEKDAIRTDRNLLEFKDDNSEKLIQLRSILMSYAMYNFDLGYCQGMSDVLAVILIVYPNDEVMAFTAFRQLLENRLKKNFQRDVKVNMDIQIRWIQVLTKQFIPTLYYYLELHEAHDMAFVFRWLLLFFKREFEIKAVLKLWDVIFACPYAHDHFQIFVAVAILKNTAHQILENNLTYDGILQFINSMAMKFDINEVLILSHEFYEECAQYTVDKKRKIRSANSTSSTTTIVLKPTLTDIIETIEFQFPPPSSSETYRTFSNE